MKDFSNILIAYLVEEVTFAADNLLESCYEYLDFDEHPFSIKCRAIEHFLTQQIFHKSNEATQATSSVSAHY